MRISTLLLAGACASILAAGADWLTDGYNSQRTFWQKDDHLFTLSNVHRTRLLWKIHLDNQPRQMHALLPALVVGHVNTEHGVKQIVIVAGVSDHIFAVDAGKGTLLWQKHFDSSFHDEPGARPGGVLCPGGITATPVIGPTSTPGKYTVYAASWDGMLHQLNVADGEDVVPPSKFMPPNGKPYALNLWKNVIYTETAQGCGGNPNDVYTYDLTTHKVGSWGPASGGMWGRSGPAIAAHNDTMFIGTGDGPWFPEEGIFGNAIIGIQQDPQTKAAELSDYYSPTNAEWLYRRDLDMQVTPTIFNYKGKELMVTAGKECRAYLLDSDSIGGDDHRTPLYRSSQLCNQSINFASAGIWGSMANWRDAKGTQWVLTPIWGKPHSSFHAAIEHGPVTHGAIIAFKVEETGGKWKLVPAWMSRDMNRAEPPLVVNGIVFAYGNGEDTDQAYPDVGLEDTAARRIPGSTHAVLYALDAETGKELWNSGDQIESWNHWSGISEANGHVYIGTFTSDLYCFGIER